MYVLSPSGTTSGTDTRSPHAKGVNANALPSFQIFVLSNLAAHQLIDALGTKRLGRFGSSLENIA